jgi:hypothetical protein
MLQLTEAYMNATIYVKPEAQNQILELMGLTKAGKTRELRCTGLGLAHQ